MLLSAKDKKGEIRLPNVCETGQGSDFSGKNSRLKSLKDHYAYNKCAVYSTVKNGIAFSITTITYLYVLIHLTCPHLVTLAVAMAVLSLRFLPPHYRLRPALCVVVILLLGPRPRPSSISTLLLVQKPQPSSFQRNAEMSLKEVECETKTDTRQRQH